MVSDISKYGSASAQIGILAGLYWEIDLMIDNFVKRGEVGTWFPNCYDHPLEMAIYALKRLIDGRRKTVPRVEYDYLTKYQNDSIDYDKLMLRFLETEKQKQFFQRLKDYTELLKKAQKSIKASKSR